MRRRSLKATASDRFAGLSDNEVANTLQRTGDALLASPEWKALRRRVLAVYGMKCMCCGHVPRNPSQINIDHVKPRKYYPEMALEESNLQVLCARCNRKKGNGDTDYRKHPAAGITD